MLAEHHALSLTSRLAISGPEAHLEGYYRSKLFISPSTTNPLLAASNPLFSLIERLSVSQSLPPIEAIRNNMEHELKAFHSKLSASNYSVELIAIAHYLLSATIDELLGKSYLRLNHEIIEFKAFTPLSRDGVEPQRRFFEIIKHVEEWPNQHLDIIELAYFCLIAGFEGEHHMRADGRQSLDNMIESLYLLIQKHRVNKPNTLFNEPALPETPKTREAPQLFKIASIMGVLALFFLSSHLLIDNKAKTVLHSTQSHWQVQ
jgi:type VI secretion system protein ImpK